jgi:hypothetical protein
MNIKLKIKSKHLAVESKIISFEQKKLQGKKVYLLKTGKGHDIKQVECLYNDLGHHKKEVVGREARATLLARAYIEVKPYNIVENKCKNTDYRTQYILPRVVDMVKKYHDYKVTKEDITNWFNADVV